MLTHPWCTFLYSSIHPRWALFSLLIFLLYPFTFWGSNPWNWHFLTAKCIKRGTGGLLFKMDDDNMQYVTSTSFLLLTYAKYLKRSSMTVSCGGTIITSRTLRTIAKKQVPYLPSLFSVWWNENTSIMFVGII